MQLRLINHKTMITAEEFFRNKLKELQPFKDVITLNNEIITAEQGMRWAHEFKQLHLHNVSGLVCDSCSDHHRLLVYQCPKCEQQEIDSDDFQPCDGCDGHDACSDFGCAIKSGLGHLIKNPL